MGHHYVPRFYLRGFAVDEAIWAYDKQTERSFPTQVKSIANETSIYSDELESHLATQVEDPAKPAIAKLRERQQLAPDERLALAKYMVVLWKRVPKARERVVARLPSVADEVRTDLHSQLDQLAERNPDLISKVDKWRGEIDAVIAKQRQKPSPEIWYHSIKSQSSPRVVDALLSMNWIFLRSEAHQFLTSDNPVFFFEHEGIGKPTSELTWPISSSVALWATRLPRPSMQFLSASRSGIREINRRTVRNSVRFIYARHDEPWILPFVSRKQWRLTRLQ
jgi:hypothetical protein